MEWLNYLLKVSACTVIFFGFYLMVLRKLTFFKLNRFYLLITLVLSFLFPAIHFEIERTVERVAENIPNAITAANQNDFVSQMPSEFTYQNDIVQPLNWHELAFYTYSTIAIILLMICVWKLVQLLMFTRKPSQTINGLKLIQKKTGFTNCSFFNYVFIDDEKITNSEMDVLLKHEQVHANQYHSIDKILIMIFKSLLWFNPIVYFYDKALEQLHEYEADEITSLSFGNQVYANLLLKLAVTDTSMLLTHNFVKSPIKDRIKMLFKLKSKRNGKLNYLWMVPVSFFLIWVFAVQVVFAHVQINLPIKYNIESANVKEDMNQKRIINLPLLVSKKSKITLIDSIRKKVLIVPEIISFSKMNGDKKTKIYYFNNVVIKIGGNTLRADEASLNEITNIILAKDASITNTDGGIVNANSLVYDLNKGIYKANSGNDRNKSLRTNEEDSNNNADSLNITFSYKADSVKFNKNKTLVKIFGNAKLVYGEINLSADEIIYDSIKKMGTAKNVILKTGNDGVEMYGSNASFDFNKKGKFEVWQSEK